MPRVAAALVVAVVLTSGCKEGSDKPTPTPAPSAPAGDSPVSKLGSLEVTARLVEVPEGAIFKRDLYDYAAILKYEVLATHRGQPHAKILYVGQYNPFKPRDQAADRRVKGIGGNVAGFTPGQVHRLALEVPLDDHFLGGIVNKYFGQDTGPLYWAVWTDADDQ